MTLRLLRDIVRDLSVDAESAAIRVAEIKADASYDERGRLVLDESGLVEVDAFEARFGELQRMGYSWLNVSHMGRLGAETHLVVIELPSSASGAPVTEINLSGPSRRVVDSGGDALADVVIARN